MSFSALWISTFLIPGYQQAFYKVYQEVLFLKVKRKELQAQKKVC